VVFWATVILFVHINLKALRLGNASYKLETLEKITGSISIPVKIEFVAA
jgi:hypothetical protein